MQIRRSLALTAGALVLAVPTLTSCGFDYATNRPYTPGEGVNSVDGENVKVLNAVVVAGQPDSGTFVASLASSSDETMSFEGISGAGGATVEPDDFTAIEIPPRGLVNLAEEGGPALSGTFEAGDFLPLTLSFDNGDTLTVTVPVVPACEEYEDLDESSPSASASPSGAYACGEDEPSEESLVSEDAEESEDEGGE